MRFCVVVLSLSLMCGCVDSSKQTDAPVSKAPAAKSGPKYLNATQPGPADPDAPKEFTELGSGLKYRLLRKTDGIKPRTSDTVLCNYRGTLDNGDEFDSSYGRGKSIDFPLTGVIKGWTEGLQYCPIGGMIELDIPADLAYGDQNKPGIPPGSRLHFIVELVDVL